MVTIFKLYIKLAIDKKAMKIEKVIFNFVSSCTPMYNKCERGRDFITSSCIKTLH